MLKKWSWALVLCASCGQNSGQKSNLADDFTKAAEKTMAKLLEKKEAKFTCFSAEERFAVHTVDIFETGDNNYPVVVRYSNSSTKKTIYRKGVSRLNPGKDKKVPLFTAKEINLDLQGNYGLEERFDVDGVVAAKYEEKYKQYVVTEDFSIDSAKIKVKKDALSRCNSN